MGERQLKIEEIHIYGYGKFENLHIRDLNDFSVFYGKNEAGKSTIMSFIHSILFGFPTRSQTELRYEPKTGNKYGGKLVVRIPGKGKVSIERVKGKATGDVTVLLKDGTIGGEELLRDLLSRMDKNLYTAVFSFNLHGLQNVHQLKSDDLGKFLFSTGTVGTDVLLTVEKNMQKELDSLFKPNGKKPVINQKLKEAGELKERLKRAVMQNEEYGNLRREKEELEKEIARCEEEQFLLQKQLHRLEEWKKLQPVIGEMARLEEHLAETEGGVFPVDGMERLGQLNETLRAMEAEIAALKEKRDKLLNKLSVLAPDRTVVEREVEINQALENLSFYEVLKQEVQERQRLREEVERDIASLREKLHLSVSDQELLNINTSVFMKERVENAAQKQIKLQERREELDRLYQEKKDDLEKYEEQVQFLKESLLPPDERKQKEEALRKAKSRDALHKELEGTREKLRLLNAFLQNEKESARKRRFQALFLTLVFLLLAGWGFWNNHWLIGVGGCLVLTFVLWAAAKEKEGQNSRGLQTEIDRLKQKEKQYAEAFGGEMPARELALLEEELKKDDELRYKLSVAEIHLKQQEEEYEKVIKGDEEWERDMREHRETLKELADELLLPGNIPFKYISEAFLLLTQLKEKIKERNRIERGLSERLSALARLENEFSALKTFFFPDEKITIKEAMMLLKKKLNEELAKKIAYEKELDRLQETEESLERFALQAEHAREAKKKLFSMAGVSGEEDFRLAAKQAEKRENLRKKLEELKDKLHLSPLSEEEINRFLKIEDADKEMAETERRLLENRKAVKTLREKLSDIKHQLAMLEDGKEYGELLHKYRLAVSELEHDAREWAKYAIAKNILRKTIDRFQNKYFPELLRKAEEYLSFLTEGNYIRILPNQEGSGFLLERKDGFFFEAKELSQATAEQLYVSLRLALSSVIYKKLPFPLMIDDSFVNFDSERVERVFKLLKEMKNNQILFFTCHDHLLKYLQDQTVIYIGKNELRMSK